MNTTIFETSITIPLSFSIPLSLLATFFPSTTVNFHTKQTMPGYVPPLFAQAIPASMTHAQIFHAQATLL